MSKHPLIEAMGVPVQALEIPRFTYKDGPSYHHSTDMVTCRVVYADELERVLESAPVVYGLVNPVSSWPDDQLWTTIPTTKNKPTHTARLICIQPIKAPDTAESLLREFVEMYDGVPQNPITRVIYDRARKLLESK